MEKLCREKKMVWPVDQLQYVFNDKKYEVTERVATDKWWKSHAEIIPPKVYETRNGPYTVTITVWSVFVDMDVNGVRNYFVDIDKTSDLATIRWAYNATIDYIEMTQGLPQGFSYITEGVVACKL